MKLVRSSIAFAAILAAACGSDGKDGAPGKPGVPGAPGDNADATKAAVTINQVSPRVGLVDRKLQVTISFDGARPDLSGVALDLGAGVKVLKTTAVGGQLVADLEIAPDAKLGAHDVEVKIPGAQSILATKAFHVAVPLDAKASAGKAEQGGLVRVDVSNRDKIWFDTENFLLLPLVDQKTPSLVPLANQGFTATDGSVVLLGDPLAKTGALGFLGVNDPRDPDSASFLSDLNAVTVGARTPVKLTSGTPVDKTLAADLETAFFVADLAPAANEGLLVEAFAQTPPDSTMKPMILAYPASGAAADLLDQKTDDPGFPVFGIPATQARVVYPVTAATKSYFVVLDANLAHGPTTKLSLAYSAVRAQVLAEKPAAHDTAQTAQNLGSLPGAATTVPGRIVTGELKAAGESDYYLVSGLSAANDTDMLVSLTSDADVLVRVDTVPTFDSDNLVEVTLGGKAGSAATTAMVGNNRYVQVTAVPDGNKQTGKYTLGFKRLPAAN